MLTRGDALALLKVLLAAGWTDSRLTQTEINYTKDLARKFQLRDEDWLELEPYLEDRPSEKEVDALFHDLLSRIATPSDRNEVIKHLEEILNADAQMTADEYDFLEQYTLILRGASTIELLVGRMRGLFRKQPLKGRMLDLDLFIRNKVLFKLRRRVGSDQITPQMHRLCLLGGLMGIVANADGEIDQRESEAIRHQLQFRGNFDPDTLDLLMTIIEEESVRGLDRARIIAEYTDNASFEERIELLDLLFAVAAANGSLTHAELEELRGISSAMHLSHRQYIDAKLRARG
ncbi:MAG: TerB family tellurite resistance protein [Acidobacteria bacterium]|nr:TerB family tellurite resistance protein [Acidobacteriota bacterium]